MKKTREKIKFNDDWYFHKGDIETPYAVKAGMTGGFADTGQLGDEGEWLQIAFVDKLNESTTKAEDWRPVTVPHDWAIEQLPVKDNTLGSRPASSGYLPVGIGYYRKEFRLEAEDEEQTITLTFDGIMRNATIWVNGHLLGTQFSGYTEIHHDISDVARYGDEGSNVVLVRVDATEYEGWWYDGCGIYRHVWLGKTPRLRIAPHGIFVHTPEISLHCASVAIETTIENRTTQNAEKLRVQYAIYDETNQLIAKAVMPLNCDSYSDTVIAQSLVVENPALWSPETPTLYRVDTQILAEEEVLDVVSTPFGIRSVDFTPEGFFLNGQQRLLQGVCCHQDFAGVGVALPDAVMEYKLRLLKEMGCDAYRSAHHTTSGTFLDLCDRIGMMVIDENRKLDSSAAGLRELEGLLVRNRNHPSVILWAMENEEIIEGTRTGARLLRTLVQTAKRIDPTRLTVACMNHGWNDGGYSEEADIVGYNYGQRQNQYFHDKKKFPHRISLNTESASTTVTRGIYQTDESKGYCAEYAKELLPWACTIEKAVRDTVENPWLSGVFLWTGFDYRGEPSPFEWPCVLSHFGIMDYCGFPKDRYHYLKANWTKEKVLHLFPHWNWEGQEGEEIQVGIYSNCRSAELFLNGKSFGVKEHDALGATDWNVPYASGTLQVVGKWEDESTHLSFHETTGAPHGIRLETDRTSLVADGADVLPIRVSIVDNKGRTVPYATNELQFSVEEGVLLLGTGNGDPSDHGMDKAGYRHAFGGKALVLIQAGTKKGTSVVTVSSPGLQTAQLVISLQ